MKIIIGSDHVGLPLKQAIVEHLHARGIQVKDIGATLTELPVDYPDFAQEVNRGVVSGAFERGVLICGTGLGMSIAANKTPGIRAAVCHDEFTAHLSRAHNDANVLCLGQWVVTPQRAIGIVDEWLNTEFEAGRHLRRLEKLNHGSEIHANEQIHSETIVSATAWRFSVSISPNPTVFAPLLFAGHLEEGLTALADAGLNGVELSLRTPHDIPVDRLNELLKTHHLALSAIASGQSCLHDGACLCAANPKLSALAVERIKGLIGLAAPFGAAVIVGGIRGKLSGTPGQQETQRCAFVEAVRDCARDADAQGVTLLIEPINQYDTNLINTTADGLALLEEIQAPSVKLLLDTYHMNLEERDMSAAIQMAGERLGYLHLVDSNRHAPGQGHLDFRPILETLAALHYTGWITAEILPRPDDRRALQAAVQFFHTLRGSPMESRADR